MKHRIEAILIMALASACSSTEPSGRSTALAPGFDYPRPTRGTVVDVYHGVSVADPYRELEDPDAPATRAWIAAQNKLTRAFLDALPSRTDIEARLARVWNYVRHSAPQERHGRYLFTKNDGLQNQGVVYTTRSLDAEASVLLDPNALRADGTAALGDMRVSPDGKLLAYQVAEAGSDWNVIRVRDIETGSDLADTIPWVKFSALAWSPDSKGLYYSTYPDHDTSGRVALKDQRVMFHALGDDVAKDAVVYARPDHPQWGFNVVASEDNDVLLMTQSEGTDQKARIFVADARAKPLAFEPIFDAFDADYEIRGKRGRRLWIRTDQRAPRNRIVAFDLGQSRVNESIEIVPEAQDTLESATLAGGKLVLVYLKDGASVVRVHELDGKPYDELKLPSIGSVGEFRGSLDANDAYFSFTSFTTPSSIWRYDVARKECAVWRAPAVEFRPDDFVTRQVFFSSKDGTRVPMFVTSRRDLVLTRTTPVLMYGYGGFNIAIKPAFSPPMLVWMERGGAYVSANLRGGSEYGREWHQAGTQSQKQNVFDDFIAAAEFLVAKGWTSPKKVAIYGRSNGGLLVGACMTQRPDLFGAAVPAVGVLDMLRYHRFTIGWAWASDYGTADAALDFAYLKAYSPLHNVRNGVRYPATLITTGDHDDRVVPAHSFKFAAELQHAVGTDPLAPPALIRIETRGGHGAGKPTSMQIEEWADVLAFIERALD